MKKIFFLVAAALALVSCDSNEDSPVTSPVAAKISATIGRSNISRAVDTTWTKGDRIGIFSVIGNDVRPYINLEYVTEDTDGKFSGTDIFFYKPMTLLAYYPFMGEDGKMPGNNGVIEADTKIDKQDADNQPKIDFLWDSKSNQGSQKDFSAANPNVNFKFTHKMSKVTFTFQSSDPVYDEDTHRKLADGVDVETMVNYTIKDLVLVGTFDTKSGVCAVKSGVAAEDMSVDVEKGYVEHNKSMRPIILFPQTLSGGSVEFHITTDELNDPKNLQHYKCRLMFSEGEIKPGYHYRYTIQVTKIGLIVGKMSIEPWVEESRSIISTIDGDEVFN